MDQPKKYRILLKPLGSSDLRSELRHAQRMLRHNQADAGHVEQLEKQFQDQLASMAPRVIDADHIGYTDNVTLLAGIEPGISTYQNRCIGASSGHAERLYKKRHTPDFYSVGHSPTGVNPHDPSHTDYIVTRKFKKILSINIDNIVSINGKPFIGRLDDLDKGVQQLGLDEDWSIDSISDLLDE